MKIFSKILSTLLVLAMVLGFVPGMPAVEAEAACYTGSTHVATIYNYSGCTGMQGMAIDDTYIYSVKIASSTQDNAIIARTHKGTGDTVYLVNGATGGYFFTELYHANDMEMVNIAGVPNLFVATGLEGTTSLIRYTLSGTTLTKVGSYEMTLDDVSSMISSAQVMSVSDTEVRFMTKRNKYMYYATLDTSLKSGKIPMTHAFTLDVAHVDFDGVIRDLTDYLHQGFEYHDGRIFVPITGESDMSISTIVVYDTRGASSTIRNDPTLSFYIQSTAYPVKFEIESCEICPSDGRLYFNTNQEDYSSGNCDAIHYITGYTYDPSHWTDRAQPFLFTQSGDSFISETTGGAVYNGPVPLTGSISDGVFSGIRFALQQSVVLAHDQPWILEWKSSGRWTDGGLLLSSATRSKNEGNTYIYRRQDSTLIALGRYSGGTFYNYGVQLGDHGIDGTADHVYRMTNKIASDGSNMVWLSVDGKELGPMNGYHIAGSPQGTTDNWVSGKDFTFSYIGTDVHPLNDCELEYLKILPHGLVDLRDDPDTYHWGAGMASTTGTGLTENLVTTMNGTVSGTTYSDSWFRLDRDVVLLHDRPWSVEWQSQGSWPGGSLLLAAAPASKAEYAPFLYRNPNGVICFGNFDGVNFDNHGITLANYGIDHTALHTYRLTNRIAADGSNMVWLYVDGNAVGPMDGKYNGGTSQGTTSDWLNGRDLTFSYLGTCQHDINTDLRYLQIWEDGIPAQHAPVSYRWETKNDTFTNITEGFTSNDTTMMAGSCTGGTYAGAWYQPEKSIVLRHDLPWSVRWASEGSWKDIATGALLLSASPDSRQVHAPYLYRRHDSEIIAFGERLDGYHWNYGIRLADHGIDGTAYHTYELVNRVADDGSNMVYLLVDGVELGAMVEQFKAGAAMGTTSDWIVGKDFVFSYIGNPDFPIGNVDLQYLQIHEGCTHDYESSTTAPTCTASGSTTYTCTLCGDSYTESIAPLGHDYTSEVTAPTCTAVGYTTYTCRNCGHSYTDDTTEKTGHDYAAVVTYPTCTAEGYTTYTCRACGHSYTDDTTEKIGHSYKGVVTAPTCTTEGYTTYTCEVCGDSYTDDVTSVSGHRYADGSCSVCGAPCDHDWFNGVCRICGMSYPARDYYLFGWIDGRDYGCEGDYENMGVYKFVDGKLTATFKQDSYVAIKAEGNADWYMAYAYPGDGVTACTLFNTKTGCGEKLFVPGGKQITFTLVDNGDDSFTLSYVAKACPHPGYDENGNCTHCGESCPVTDPGLTLSYPTLSFEDEIIYNVYFSVGDTSSIVEMGLMILPKMDQSATIEDATALVPGYVTNGVAYLAKSEGVPAANMGDTLYFKVYAKLTDGTYAYSGAGGYNAKAYASSILKGDNSDEMKSLAVSMLNYGAEAQLYFGHNTDKLVNNALTAEQQALVKAYDTTMMDAIVKADSAKTGNFVRVNSNFKSLYPSVSFDGAFAINFYCMPAITVDSGMTLYYWDMETMASVDKLSIDNATGSMEMTDTNGMYWGQVAGIAAKEMDKTYYVTCVFQSNGETVTTGIIPYSLGKYCSDKAATDGDAQQAFAQATAVYGYYAKQYFASIA